MINSARIRLLAAALALPLAVGIGAAISAPVVGDAGENVATNDDYRPGEFGIDFAAITGPRAPSDPAKVPACADPARQGELRPCIK